MPMGIPLKGRNFIHGGRMSPVGTDEPIYGEIPSIDRGRRGPGRYYPYLWYRYLYTGYL